MQHAWQRHQPFGGHRFLDFVNTVDDERKSRLCDALPDWATVLAWGRMSALLTPSEAADLEPASAAATEAERLALIDLREAAYAVLSTCAAGVAAPEGSRSTLEATMAQALARATLAASGDGLRWRATAALGPAVVRVRLGLDALDLLACGDFRRLKECGRCTGLYLDHGRGVGRRWCRMSTCGNRAKVERHRRRG